jgi:methionine synthase I (cobalamin-dependent)
MTTTERTRLRDLISARGCALFDGAMGTMLQGAGLEAGESGERWNLERSGRPRHGWSWPGWAIASPT